MTTIAAIERMAPITLAELVETADRQTRIDRKYLVDTEVAERLVAQLVGAAKVLRIDGSAESAYSSTYFDTPELICFRHTALRRRRRFKVRTRRYIDTHECYLEVKTRGGRGTTVKQRVEHPATLTEELTDTAVQYVDLALTEAGIEHPATQLLCPVLRTDYHRSTLCLPGSGSRLTIDRNLCWQATDGRRTWVGDLVVIETKSGAHPTIADRLLWASGRRPV